MSARGFVAIVAVTSLVALAGCGGASERLAVPGVDGATKTVASARAERRAYDGAPPVIPHENFGIECTDCHDREGVDVPDVGYAPASPHAETAGMSAISRCRQCHVFSMDDGLFAASDFVGLRQDLRRGGRLHPIAPPTIPHKVFMRENCSACHTGAAAREEIRCTHPERIRCRQCHVEVATRAAFRAEGATP